MRPTLVLVTVTGRDRPGVTAIVFAALAAHDVDVRDVVQTVNGHHATLTVLVDLRGDAAALRHSVGSTTAAVGVESQVDVVDEGEPMSLGKRRPRPRPGPGRSRAVVLSRQLRAGAIGDVAKRISDVGGNIESMWQSSRAELAGVEMYIDGDAKAVRKSLIGASAETGLDIAVEPAAARRPARQLLVLDADATLSGDVGDARFGPRVVQFVRAVQGSGCRVAAVATARRSAADTLADMLELDAAAAVRDRAGKAAALERLAAAFEVRLPHAVAVGDARRSDRLLSGAGMAVGVDGRSARHAATDRSGEEAYLDSVLFVLDVPLN
jgi:phosphoserine phosphatase